MAWICYSQLKIQDLMMRWWFRFLAFILLAVYIASCKPVPVSHWFPVTPLEHYEKELYQAKFEKTTAGQTWLRVSEQVLFDSVFSVAPYQERFFLGDSVPAQALRLKIPQGRKLVIMPIRSEQDSSAHFFMELFKVKTNGKTQRLDYLKEDTGTLVYENDDQDTLLLRLQTGLNEKLTVMLSLATLPTLSFPVAGHSMADVISAWGAERDGGVRSHEGIDIRARRGTPVVAAQNGFITQTGTNNLGGKIVFLSSLSNPYSLYYAHLDSQLVSVGQRVTLGDTLGLVGNTGNAITTAPHLHFGIYARGAGAVNPLPFVNDRKEKMPDLPKESQWLGDTVLIRKKANIYSSSQLEVSEKIGSLPANTIVRILGEMSRGYRVQLENGTKGFIPTVPLQARRRDVSQASIK